jgi:hypothetical protein
MKKEIFDVIAESWEFQYSDKSLYSKIESEEDATIVLFESHYDVITTNSRRHWEDIEVVAEFPTKDKTYYIGWWDARTTGDLTADEKGWKFDPETISFYEKEEIIVKQNKYTRKE